MEPVCREGGRGHRGVRRLSLLLHFLPFPVPFPFLAPFAFYFQLVPLYLFPSSVPLLFFSDSRSVTKGRNGIERGINTAVSMRCHKASELGIARRRVYGGQKHPHEENIKIQTRVECV